MSTSNSSPSAQWQMISDAAHRRSILVTVCVALMAVIAAVTGLNVAQPHLALDLNATHADVLWMINTYAITLAALLLPLGAAGDRWGRKPVLLAGLAIFAVANAASGLAPSTEIMLAARFMSGVGAAMIMPVTLSVITSAFPDKERSKAIGIWSGVAGGGGVLGMFLSALLVDFLSWRFLFILPIALVAISGVMAIRSVPNSRENDLNGFDFVGAALSAVAIVGLIFFLHEGPEKGWLSYPTLTAMVVGGAASLAFVWWELRHKAPLLDFRFFKKRNLSSGSTTLVVWFGVQAGVFIVLFPFFQAVLGWSGLMATLGLMPMAILMMGFSGVAPHLSARIGPRLTMAAGILLGGFGLGVMSLFVSVDGGFWSVLPGMAAMGIGMGLCMAPSTEAITSSLPRDKQGVASALNDVTREFGTALGVALLGAVFTAGYASSIAPRLTGVPAEAADLASRSIAYAQDMVEGNAPYAEALYGAAQDAFVRGWQQAMWAGVVVMALLLIFILLRGPEATPNEAQE